MDRRQALVFAGAGASTAVDREQYPTTLAFYEKLPDSVKNDSFIKSIEKWTAETLSLGTSPLDIEVVLWAIDELLLFLNKLSSADFPLYMLRNNILTELTRGRQPEPLPNVAPIVARYSNLTQPLQQLKAEINRFVYEFYARVPKREQLLDNWLPLLEGLRENGFQIEIATTNYDLILEQALEFLDWPYKPATGRPNTGVLRYLDLDVWRNPPSPHGALTKLHGSVDWSYMDEANILVGNPQFKADHKMHALIYPGFKGMPSTEESILFHNYFAQAVSSSDLLIFIGFAFRDEYLNQIINNNLSPSARVIIINPQTSTLRLPFDLERTTLLSNYFNIKSITECIAVSSGRGTR